MLGISLHLLTSRFGFVIYRIRLWSILS